MPQVFRTVSTKLWLQQIFDVKSARYGGVVRRKLRDVERNAGLTRLQAQVLRRGDHTVLNGEQVVIFCNNEPVSLLC
ncbi:N-(5'-phosphoribosyl)anthranilate isomerase [Leisingera daeponensis]|uniref:N-(5'-phosphoribosyl)anthranilate isomerase n=1 Tax=Leisingera daeponensis TaxID=405746 RepID=UPI0021BD9EB8|nr:N-(5'-phosphoribosyl)anthranilate isomerase [Leisingera daeponensis]